MSFLSRLEVGREYVFHTPWGQERVRLTELDGGTLTARGLDDGMTKVFRESVILAYFFYEESAAPQREPADEAPPELGFEKPDEEPEEPATEIDLDGIEDIEEVYSVKTLTEAVAAPEAVGAQERMYGLINAFYASPAPGGGYGYILVPEDGKPRKKGAPQYKKVFFHISQVSEKNLYTHLKSFDTPPPDESGRRMPAYMPTPLRVSYLPGENRSKTNVIRPVANDVRLTAEMRRFLAGETSRAESMGGLKYVDSVIGYFLEYKMDSFSALACKLYIPNEKGESIALMLEDNIVNPYLKRYLSETRPQQPGEIAFAMDIFARQDTGEIGSAHVKRGRGRPKKQASPVYIAAHVSTVGATPWQGSDEARWDLTLSPKETSEWELFHSGNYSRESLALVPLECGGEAPQQPETPVESPVYDDGTAVSEYYIPIRP